MKIHSIIDNIRDSIATGTGEKVSIHDRSFLDVLFHDLGKSDITEQAPNHRKRRHSVWCRYIWHRYLRINPRDRVPVSTLLLKIIVLISALPLLMIYLLAYGFSKLRRRRCTLEDVMHSPRINILIFFGVVILLIVALIHMLVFFMKDVTFYSPQRDINAMGALTITQPCQQEYYILLHNSANPWADTGIDVMKGDVVSITASGSFYSSIGEKSEKALNNEKLQYSLINVAYGDSVKSDRDSAKNNGLRYCIYKNKDDARFGSLLYQIQPSRSSCGYIDNGEIFQAKVNPKSHLLQEEFIVKKSGTLFICLNDIYLSEEIVKSMFDTTQTPVKIKGEAKLILDKYVNKIVTEDSLYKQLLKLSKDNPDIWLRDNCGEVLLNISVQRNIWASDKMLLPNKIYNSSFRAFEDIFMSRSKIRQLALWYFSIALIAWFFLDYLFGVFLRSTIASKFFNKAASDCNNSDIRTPTNANNNDSHG